jgi:hypothetical protein
MQPVVWSVAMLVQDAVKIVNNTPGSWVRLGAFRRVVGGIDLLFSVHDGKKGRKIDGWSVTCRGVQESQITEVDGGGLRLYSSSHPAARQYSVARAQLRWSRTCDEANMLAALYKAHANLVGDWIEFDRYLPMEPPWSGASHMPPLPGKNFICRGPDFLLRAYTKALNALGEEATLTIQPKSKDKNKLAKVLHFGSSYIIANTFEALRDV